MTNSAADLSAKMRQRISGGDVPASARVSSLSAPRRPGEAIAPPGSSPSSNRLLVVIDDVSLNAPEAFGAHPPLEVLRFWLEHGGFYDPTKLTFNAVVETQWLLCGSASGSVAVRHVLPDRLARHAHILCMPSPGSDTIGSIFKTIVSGFLSADLAALGAVQVPTTSAIGSSLATFSADLRKAGEAAVSASMSLLSTISQEVRPSPARLQYSLDPLRDIARVVDGIAQARPGQVDDATTFARLWLHEALRVFYDRMTSVKHQLSVSQSAVDCVSRFFHLQMRHEAVMAVAEQQQQQPQPGAAPALLVRDHLNAGPVIFGRFAHQGAAAMGVAGAGAYEELLDADEVMRVMYTSMSEHDMMHPSDKPMSDLVSGCGALPAAISTLHIGPIAALRVAGSLWRGPPPRSPPCTDPDFASGTRSARRPYGRRPYVVPEHRCGARRGQDCHCRVFQQQRGHLAVCCRFKAR